MGSFLYIFLSINVSISNITWPLKQYIYLGEKPAYILGFF